MNFILGQMSHGADGLNTDITGKIFGKNICKR